MARRYRVSAVGFYKKDGKVRPVTARSGRRRGRIKRHAIANRETLEYWVKRKSQIKVPKKKAKFQIKRKREKKITPRVKKSKRVVPKPIARKPMPKPKKEVKPKRAKEVSIPKGEIRYGDEPIATYVNQRSGAIFDIYPSTSGGFWERQRDYKGLHISGATSTLDETGLHALEDAKKRGIIKVVHGKLPELEKEPKKPTQTKEGKAKTIKEKGRKVTKVKKEKMPKPKIQKKPRKPLQKMTHIERMHLMAACKQFGIDPQEVDNTINYYENKKHIQELAHMKGISEGEITSMDQQQSEWTMQYQQYLDSLRTELETAGYEIKEPDL